MAKQYFTLEFLEARGGDCLLLHYGPEDEPRLIVIDGGPARVYDKTLKVRLEEIRNNRGGQLQIRMVMVSHIDDDHINGVCKMFKELRTADQERRPLPYDVLTLWHNSYDDLIAKIGVSGAAALPPGAARKPEAAAIVASVGQGRTLRNDANTLGINMNSGFDDLIFFDAATKPLNIGPGLEFTVLGPRKAELDRLRAEWKTQLKEILKKEAAKQSAEAAEFIDTSVPNLSSIVVLVKFAGKKMLLTGDARGDHILESLRDLKLVTDDQFLEVDVLKIPHHGSARNSAEKFFDRVRAPVYVISAENEGASPNPSPVTLKELYTARPEGGYTIWLTNPPSAEVSNLTRPPGVQLLVRDDAKLSERIELGDPITW